MCCAPSGLNEMNEEAAAFDTVGLSALDYQETPYWPPGIRGSVCTFCASQVERSF